MKNYIRFFWIGLAPCVALVLGLTATAINASVLTLDFADGAGTTSVDQFAGVAGSGWKTGWTNSIGSSTSSYSGTVTNATPLYVGGDNYLSLTFSVTGANTTNQWLRTSRQIDSAAINLSSALTYSFTLRPDSIVSGSNEYFTIFSATAATNFTGGTDTWKITADGGGWHAYSGGTIVDLGKVGASALLGTDYQFIVYSDPTSQTWALTINNLTNGTSTSSGTMVWRSTATTENSFINIVSGSGSTSAATFGYSLDNISIVPEPVTTALLAISGFGWVALRVRRRSSC